jgi:deazaflavin-dependent oxidoreductase (nitroreductase family)
MSNRQRMTRWLATHRWFLAFGKLMVPLDTAMQRASGGRLSVMAGSGMPHLLLTVTGARSGLPRRVPLLYVPDGERYLVIGSNWGKPAHPAWSANLLANPEAVVNLSGREVAVRARLADGAERERLWAASTALWPAYDGYAARAGRPLRLFVLEPVSGPGGAAQRS